MEVLWLQSPVGKTLFCKQEVEIFYIHKHIAGISAGKRHTSLSGKKEKKNPIDLKIFFIYLANNVFSRNTSLYNYISSRFLLFPVKFSNMSNERASYYILEFILMHVL